MLPVLLVTVSRPSATVQPAGDWSRVDTHSSRFLPSNNTMASDGGRAPWPGLTIFGTGCHTSVSAGFPLGRACCAASGMARTVTSANTVRVIEASFECGSPEYRTLRIREAWPPIPAPHGDDP